MKKIFDAVVSNGKYTQNGQEKTRYLNVGAVFEGDKGLSLKLDALPTVGFTGWINFYEPKPREQTGNAPASDFDDDKEIPF
jgi:hypothetical protein